MVQPFEEIGKDKQSTPSFDEIEAGSESVPSFDDIQSDHEREHPFAYGIDRVLTDKRLKEFLNQDTDEDTKYKLANSLYVSNTYKVPFNNAYANYDGVVNEMFKGKKLTPKQVFEKIQWMEMDDKQRFENYHANTGAWDEFKNFFSSRWQRGKGMFAGLMEFGTDAAMGMQKAVTGRTFGYNEQLNEWSVSMRDGVKKYMEENPGQFLNVPGDGFWDTTANYIAHPEIIAAGVVEQLPYVIASTVTSGSAGALAKVAGASTKIAKTASFIGGVEGFAIPLTGERYSSLRMEGVPPMTAIPEAFLAAQSEGILENWTRTFNMRLFHGAGSTAKKGISEMAAKWLLGKPMPVKAAAFAGAVYGQGFSEEGLQGISDNFWEMMFRNPDKDLMEGVLNQAAGGGLLELAMGSSFKSIGKAFRMDYSSEAEQLAKIESLREIFNDEKMGLNLQQKEEINQELDTIRNEVIEGKYNSQEQGTDSETPNQETPFSSPPPETPGLATLPTAATVEGGKQPRYETDNLPQPLADGSRNRRREILQARIGRGESAPVKLLEEFKGEPWADQILSSGLDTTGKTGDTIRMAQDEASRDIAPQDNATGQGGGKHLTQEVKQKTEEQKPVAVPEKNPARFGIEETSGGWIVKDWETQKELTEPTNQRAALNAMKEYNQGIRVVKEDRRSPLLPSESVTLSARKLFNLIMEAESKEAKHAYMEGAKDIIKIHKDLGRYAHMALKGLDITQGQRQSLIAALTQATNEAERVVALANIHKIRYEAKKAQAITELRQLIAVVNRKTGKSMQEKGIRSEYLEKIKAVTETMGFKKYSDKSRKRVESLKNYLQTIKEKELSQYEEAYIESLIPKSLLDKVEKMQLKPVQNLGLEELQETIDTVQQLLHLNDLKNQLIMNQVGKNVASQLNQAMEEVGELKTKREIEGALSSLDKPREEPVIKAVWNYLLGNKNFDIETLAEIISAGNHGAIHDILANGFSEGREVQYQYENEWDDIQRKEFENAGITLRDLQDFSRGFFQFIKNDKARKFLTKQGIDLKNTKEYTVKVGGKDTSFTLAELMSIYMHVQSYDNLSEILRAGIAFPTHSIGEISVDEIEAIAKIVESNPKAKALCEMANKLHDYSASKINDVSRKLKGIDIAKLENYWHRQRFTGGGVAGTQAYRNSLLETEGRLQERTGSGNPVIIRDFFEVLFADQQSIAEYVGLAEPLRVMKNLMNYRPFRDSVREKGYENELKMIDTLIERAEQKPHYYSSLDTPISKATHGLARAVLANPGIMLGQYASVGLYFTEVDTKYISALKMSPNKEVEAKFKRHWHTYRRRVEGGASSVEMSDLSQTDAMLKAYLGKESYLNYLTEGIHYMDSLSITEAGRIVEAEMKDKELSGKSLEYWMNRDIDPTTLEPDSDQYWTEFVKRANYIIRRTQSMFQPENRSIHTSDPSQSVKMWFMFRSSVDPHIRILHAAWNQYKYGKISQKTLIKQFGTVWASLAAFEVMRSVIDTVIFRSDDDEKDLLEKMFVAPVMLMPIFGYPMTRALKAALDTAFQGEPFRMRDADITTLPVQGVIDITNAVIQIMKGASYVPGGERFKTGDRKGKLKSEEYMKDGFVDLTTSILKYCGIPAKVIKDAVYGKGKEDDKKQKPL